MNQLDDDDGTRSGGVLGNESRLLLLRHSYMYLDNKELGQVRWGLTPTPIYNITKDTNVTELEDTMHSDDRMNQGFFLRPKGGNTEKDLSTLKWQDISRCYGSSNAFVCSTRRNGVAYWTPEWSGFSASWGVFEDDIWGGALRYKNSFSPFGGGTGPSKEDTWEVGAGFGYEKYRDENIQNSGGGLNGFKRDIDEWAGSASIKHKPTGLFFMGAFSVSQNNDSNREHAGVFDGKSSPDMNAYDLQIGIQRKFIELGELIVLRRLQQYQRRHRRRRRRDPQARSRHLRERERGDRDHRRRRQSLVSRLRPGGRRRGHAAPLRRLSALRCRRRPDRLEVLPTSRRRWTISSCSTPAPVSTFKGLISFPWGEQLRAALSGGPFLLAPHEATPAISRAERRLAARKLWPTVADAPQCSAKSPLSLGCHENVIARQIKR